MKKWVAVVCVLCCIMVAMPYAVAEFAPLYEGYMKRLNEGEAVTLEMTPILKAYSPFPKERIEPMNRILKNTTITMYMADGQTDFAINLGKGQLVAFRLTDDGKEATLSGEVLGDKILYAKSGQSPLAALFGTGDFDSLAEGMLSEDTLFHLKETMEAVTLAMTQTQAEGKTANDTKNFKGIGKAAKRTLYTLPASEANTLLNKGLSGIQSLYFAGLTQPLAVTGETAKLTLYKDKQGSDLAQVWTFTATIGEEERKCSLTWAYAQTDAGRKDDIQLTHTDMSGKDKRSFTAKTEAGSLENGNRLSLETAQAYSLSGENAEDAYQLELTCTAKDNMEQLTGTLTYTKTIGEETSAFVIRPETVAFAYDGQTVLSGKLNVQLLQNGDTKLEGEVAFDIKPGEPLDVKAGARRVSLGDADITALQKEVGERVARNALLCAFTLPMNDLTLLTEFIDENTLSGIISSVATSIPMPENEGGKQ